MTATVRDGRSKMQGGDSGRGADEVEAFKLPVAAENIASGRLGGIYKALDRKT